MPFWFTLLLYVGMELLRPKPKLENAKPSSLGDFQIPTANEGRVVPIVWGTVRMNGPNIGWYGDLETRPIRKKVKTGLFSSSRVTTGYRYYLGIDFLLCRGTLEPPESPQLWEQGIRRIWVDDDLIRTKGDGWLASGAFTLDDDEFFGKDSGGIVGDCTLYPGDVTQAQSSYMANLADVTASLLPAYRGTAHFVLEHAYIGKGASLRPWAIEVRRIPDPLGLGLNAIVNGNDANPANVIYEIMTDNEWGLGLANVDASQMASVGVLLAAEGNGYARILDNPAEALEIISEIEQQIDGVLTQDIITKDWQVKLIRESDYPSPTSEIPLFNEGNIYSLTFTRGAWADTTNQVKIEYTDRKKDFKTTYAIAQDMANKQIQGGVDVISSQSYPGVQDRTLANDIAWRDLRTLSYPLAKGKIKADRSNYTVRPGDLARITWGVFGLEDFIVRINRVVLGGIDANEMIYDFVEDMFTTTPPAFSDATDTLWVGIVDEPVDVVDARIIPLPLSYQDTVLEQQYGVVAAKSNGVQSDYDVYVSEDNAGPTIGVDRADAVLNLENIPFTPSGLLDAAVSNAPADYENDTITITSTTDMDVVNLAATVADLNLDVPPNIVVIGDEWMFFRTLTEPTPGQYQLNNVYRGMFDTPVQDHAISDRVWFISYAMGLLFNLTPPSFGFAAWFMSNSGAGIQGQPSGSPEVGVVRTQEIVNRFQGPSAPIFLKVGGSRVGDVTTLPTSFSVDWNNRATSFITRTYTQDEPNQTFSPDGTVNIRVYHTGQSPEALVYNQTGIAANASVSPVGGQQTVSGYAVPFSPDVSPVPSPHPFPQTYRIEVEGVLNGYTTAKWSQDFNLE